MKSPATKNEITLIRIRKRTNAKKILIINIFTRLASADILGA